jgi:osmoprotectant transport system substrate-binding protein
MPSNSARRRRVPKDLRPRSSRLLLALVLALPLVSCVEVGRGPVGARTPAVVTGDDAITIGSFAFPESVLLAEIFALALEDRGFEVKRAFDLGARELVAPALERSLVEFVPEYLGSALEFVTGGRATPTADVQAAQKELAEAFKDRGIMVLVPAPAQDVNTLAVTARTAAKHHLEKVSDLAPIAGQLVFGGPPECPDRPFCLPGLQANYGIEFERFQGLDASGPLTAAALASGQVDVALLFSTDGAIRTNGFILLEDDRGLQPAENVTPVIRKEIVAAYGTRLTDAVDAVSAMLTTAELGEMNYLMSLGEGTKAVAMAWLQSHGLVKV